MSLNLITGYAGKAHITSAGDGAVNAAIYGGGRYVLNAGECFGYELLSNNQIRIKSGYAMNQGRKIELAVSDYEDIEIDNGLQGVKRCDLIVISYEKNVASGIETATMKVIKGTSGDDYTDPEYTSGDILSGAILDDFPLYRVKINGLNVEAVEKLFEVRKGITEDDLKNNVSTFDSTDTLDADANTWTSVEKLHSGETMRSILGKIAAMFKNIRYLYKAHDYDRNTKITEYYYSNTADEIIDTSTGNVINKIYSRDKGKNPYSTVKEFLTALMESMAAFYQYFVGYVNPQLDKAITTENIKKQSVNSAESATTAGKLSTSAGSAARPVYFKDGKPVQIDYTLAEACKRGVKTASGATHTDYGTNNDYVPDMRFLAFWNGAYNADGKSNLARCIHGALGTMAVKSANDYVPKSGGAFTGEISVPDNKALKAGNKVLIMTTEEGGNIAWQSPNGTKYEMDSFSNEFTRIYSGDGDKHIFRLYANGQFDTFYLQSDNGALRDRTGDNQINSGTSGHRWKQVYAGTATISTSDRNLKKDIKELDESHLKFFLLLTAVSYQFIDGDSGRTHIGFIAQDVEDAMAQCGLTALDFAGFCKDVKVQTVPVEKEVELEDGTIKTYTDYVDEAVLDADGNPKYIYSLRYEEFIALVTYATQKLYKKVDELGNWMEQMEERLVALEK